MMRPFLLDGVAYNVNVTSLTRKFAVMESGSSGTTQDGSVYRDIIGTFYHYAMTVEPRDGDEAAMEAFWEAVSRPETSHVCEFPYGQKTLIQRMYVTSGEQGLRLLTPGKTHWGELSLEFTAAAPGVTP